jgi:hypothetical protein
MPVPGQSEGLACMSGVLGGRSAVLKTNVPSSNACSRPELEHLFKDAYLPCRIISYKSNNKKLR